MKKAFEYAYMVLNQAVHSFHPAIVDTKQSILGRIIRVTDEVIQYRQWIQEKFPVDNGAVGNLSTLLPLDTQSEQQEGNCRSHGKRMGSENDSSPASSNVSSAAHSFSSSPQHSSCSSVGSDTDSDPACDSGPEKLPPGDSSLENPVQQQQHRHFSQHGVPGVSSTPGSRAFFPKQRKFSAGPAEGSVTPGHGDHGCRSFNRRRRNSARPTREALLLSQGMVHRDVFPVGSFR